MDALQAYTSDFSGAESDGSGEERATTGTYLPVGLALGMLTLFPAFLLLVVGSQSFLVLQVFTADRDL